MYCRERSRLKECTLSLLEHRSCRILSLAAILVASASSVAVGRVSAQTAPAAPKAVTTGKVGLVNIQDALLGTTEGKSEFDALQQRFAPMQAKLKAQNDELENLKTQLQTLGSKLSAAERERRMDEISNKERVLKRNYEDAQATYQKAEQEVMGRLGPKMLSVLEKYATGNGFWVILDISSQSTPILWAAQGADITKELVAAYNAAQTPAKK
jgi:outer membrane protein